MDLIYWDHFYDKILAINLVIITGLFLCLRLFSGIMAHINASDELLRKDNPAFGISMAGVILGITIILSGTIYGNPESDAETTAFFLAMYGVVGITILALTRIIFDKITLPAISIKSEILKGNIAVAIADASNILAAAIIIRAALAWITGNSVEGFLGLLIIYGVSQTILTGATLIKFKVFSTMTKGRDIQEELHNGNIALALRFAGQKIGTAFAIIIASKLIVSEIADFGPMLIAWFLLSIVTILILKTISYFAERVIFFGARVNSEVLNQRNIAVGALQGAIYISLGLLLSDI